MAAQARTSKKKQSKRTTSRATTRKTASRKPTAKRPETRPAARRAGSRDGASRRATRERAVTTAPLSSGPRITYMNLTLSEDDNSTYDAAIGHFREMLGEHYSNLINGEFRGASDGREMEHRSPADTRLIVSYVPRGTREDAVEAIRAARLAANEWARMPWQKRNEILRRAVDLMYERAWEAAAIMAFEVGKPRAEGIAEVYEAAELMRFYCDAIERNKGFVYELSSPGRGQRTLSVLVPYGVFGVISPWNFPLALLTGMSSAALAGGNTVVAKPASESPVSAYFLARCLVDAGLPPGVFNLVAGPGGSVGEELRRSEMVDGLAFTGSYDVGMQLYHNFATTYPKPVIAEMGGKNPVIVTRNANLELAAEGVTRGAFGFSGQKCSATSRIYVDREIKGEFLERLIDATRDRVKVGMPFERETFMGPVMNQNAVETWQKAVDDAERSRGRILYGGSRVREGDLEHGYYVEPTIVDNLAPDHRLFKEELFVPFVAVQETDTLEQAMDMANDVTFGLTAGIYSDDAREVEYFFDNIEAGVTYANRRAGATTGAWPTNNTFGGWKGSGSSGHNAFGPHYLQHFMREQSRWIVEPEAPSDKKEMGRGE
jgi:1-pyrroline-5-carboxylate dehydrogenase